MPHITARDGTRLYYEEAGQGTPVVFVHEYAADYRTWEPQMRRFSRSHRCVTYSQRGVEFFRFLARERVAGARDDHEPRGWHRAA